MDREKQIKLLKEVTISDLKDKLPVLHKKITNPALPNVTVVDPNTISILFVKPIDVAFSNPSEIFTVKLRCLKNQLTVEDVGTIIGSFHSKKHQPIERSKSLPSNIKEQHFTVREMRMVLMKTFKGMNALEADIMARYYQRIICDQCSKDNQKFKSAIVLTNRIRSRIEEDEGLDESFDDEEDEEDENGDHMDIDEKRTVNNNKSNIHEEKSKNAEASDSDTSTPVTRSKQRSIATTVTTTTVNKKDKKKEEKKPKGQEEKIVEEKAKPEEKEKDKNTEDKPTLSTPAPPPVTTATITSPATVKSTKVDKRGTTITIPVAAMTAATAASSTTTTPQDDPAPILPLKRPRNDRVDLTFLNSSRAKKSSGTNNNNPATATPTPTTTISKDTASLPPPPKKLTGGAPPRKVGPMGRISSIPKIIDMKKEPEVKPEPEPTQSQPEPTKSQLEPQLMSDQESKEEENPQQKEKEQPQTQITKTKTPTKTLPNPISTPTSPSTPFALPTPVLPSNSNGNSNSNSTTSFSIPSPTKQPQSQIPHPKKRQKLLLQQQQQKEQEQLEKGQLASSNPSTTTSSNSPLTSSSTAFPSSVSLSPPLSTTSLIPTETLLNAMIGSPNRSLVSSPSSMTTTTSTTSPTPTKSIITMTNSPPTTPSSLSLSNPIKFSSQQQVHLESYKYDESYKQYLLKPNSKAEYRKILSTSAPYLNNNIIDYMMGKFFSSMSLGSTYDNILALNLDTLSNVHKLESPVKIDKYKYIFIPDNIGSHFSLWLIFIEEEGISIFHFDSLTYECTPCNNDLFGSKISDLLNHLPFEADTVNHIYTAQQNDLSNCGVHLVSNYMALLTLCFNSVKQPNYDDICKSIQNLGKTPINRAQILSTLEKDQKDLLLKHSTYVIDKYFSGDLLDSTESLVIENLFLDSLKN
ncbi:hypothetical protein CYY_005754 [Polysphondylium violaceum]|uniref:Ubiquitin-like protease family profile domain-containing protein n=1 Tax=Polysphondylium violaceum TaxID=133409 RepID=A0A8J4V3U9_9MYCE|nr:hypothetical protein CYY_005754 [Polysphondylium violaceum]